MIPRLRMASQRSGHRDLESSNLAGAQQEARLSPDVSAPPDEDKPLVISLGGWQLHRASECHLSTRLASLEKGSAARYWLQAHRKDIFAMTAMRKALLVEGSSLLLTHLLDEDVIEQVAHLLKRGRWHVCEPMMQVHKVIALAQPAFAPAPRRAVAPAPAPPPVVEIPEDPSLSRNADHDALAAVLTDAAASGVPFCEECAKMASVRTA